MVWRLRKQALPADHPCSPHPCMHPANFQSLQLSPPCSSSGLPSLITASQRTCSACLHASCCTHPFVFRHSRTHTQTLTHTLTHTHTHTAVRSLPWRRPRTLQTTSAREWLQLAGVPLLHSCGPFSPACGWLPAIPSPAFHVQHTCRTLTHMYTHTPAAMPTCTIRRRCLRTTSALVCLCLCM